MGKEETAVEGPLLRVLTTGKPKTARGCLRAGEERAASRELFPAKPPSVLRARVTSLENRKMTQSVKCYMFKPVLGALALKSEVGCGSIHLQSQRWEGRSKGSQGFAAQLVQSNQETPGSVRGPVS